MDLSPFQIELRDRVEAVLRQARIESKVKLKVTRFEGEDDDAGGVERSLVFKFRIGSLAYEVWIYEDAAGIVEPGDEWWPFDLDDFATSAAAAEALVSHLRKITDDEERAAP
jgi:hypothetical protein